MTLSFYQRQMAAAWVMKHLEEIEEPMDSVSIELRKHWLDDRSLEKIIEDGDLDYGFMFHVQVSLPAIYGSGSDQLREARANRIIEKIPGTRVYRNDGQIYLYGLVPGYHELRWHISAGQGVCERKQVGTRKVMRPDPSAPLVEVIEPIFETICLDPIAAAGA